MAGGGGGSASTAARSNTAPAAVNNPVVPSPKSPWGPQLAWNVAEPPTLFSMFSRNCDCKEGTLLGDKCGDGDVGEITEEVGWNLVNPYCRTDYVCTGGGACSCYERGGSNAVGGSEARGFCQSVLGDDYTGPADACLNVQCEYNPTLYEGKGGCDCTLRCAQVTTGCATEADVSFTKVLCTIRGDVVLHSDYEEACWGPFDPQDFTEWQAEIEEDRKALLEAVSSAAAAELLQAAREALQEIADGRWAEGGELAVVTSDDWLKYYIPGYDCSESGCFTAAKANGDSWLTHCANCTGEAVGGEAGDYHSCVSKAPLKLIERENFCRWVY